MRIFALGALASLVIGSVACDRSGDAPQTAKTGAKSAPGHLNTRGGRDSARIDKKALLEELVRVPGDPASAWERIQDADIAEKEKRALEYQLIENLAAKGRLKEAYDLIAASTGPGERRDGLIFSLFTKNDASIQEVFRFTAENFQSTKDKWSALQGIARSLGNPAGAARLQAYLDGGGRPDNDQAVALASGLAIALDVKKSGLSYYNDPNGPLGALPSELPKRFGDARLKLEQLIEVSPEGAGRMVDQFLRISADVSPDLTWSAYLDLKEHLSDRDRTNIGSQLVGDLIRQSGGKAFDELVGQGETYHLRHAMDTWIQADSTQAIKWFEEKKTSMTEEQAGIVSGGVVRYLGQQQNFKEGWAWADRIQDPSLRQKVTGELWTQERQQVTQAAQKNPQEAIDSIVSGKSEHAPYWIETAMNEWVAKDEAAAWDWYEANRKKLTSQQNEAVALTYARNAIKMGQPDVAAQWAQLVVTPKFRKEIESELLAVPGQ